MKKVLAVIVSLLWLGLILGVPALVLTGNLDRFLPQEFRGVLDQSVLKDIQDLIPGVGPAQPSPTAAPIGEPVVVAETPTPQPPSEAAQPPTDTPAPPPPPTDTPTPVPPTATPAEEPATTPTESGVEIPPPAAFPVAVIGQADLRAGPGEEYDVVGGVDAGATVLVDGQDPTGEWFRTDTGAWIAASALATRPPVGVVTPTPEASPTPTETPVEATPTPIQPAAAPVTATVNADANLRAGPGVDFERVGGVNFGSQVTVVGRYVDGDWYLLDNGAWIFGALIDDNLESLPLVDANGQPVSEATPEAPAPEETTPVPEETPAPEEAAQPVTNVIANLRAGPSTDTEIVETVPQGTPLVIVGRNEAGDWYKLESGAWIFAQLVDNAPADVPVVSDTEPAPEETPAAEETASPAETPAPEETPAAEETPVPEETPAAEETPAPAETPAAEETPAPAEGQAVAIVDANLRAGPSTDFDIVGAVTAGTPLTIIGRNEAGDWYKLDNGAWIFAQLVDNAPADLPVVQ